MSIKDFCTAHFAVGALVAMSMTSLASASDSYTLAWTNSGFRNQRDFSDGVVVDSNDKIYVTGESGPIYGTGSNLGSSVALVAKYNATGAQEWLTQAYSTLQLDHPSGIAIDAANNVYIAGETYRYAVADAFLVKYNQAGTRLWEQHVGSPSNEFGYDVAVDVLGNVYMCGSTTGNLGVGRSGGGYDGFVVKYDPNGGKQWTMQFDDSIGDFADSIAVDPSGNFFVAVGNGGLDSSIAKFDGNRNLLWRITPNFSSVAGGHTAVYETATDASGDLFIVGQTNARSTTTASALLRVMASLPSMGPAEICSGSGNWIVASSTCLPLWPSIPTATSSLPARHSPTHSAYRATTIHFGPSMTRPEISSSKTNSAPSKMTEPQASLSITPATST